MSEQPPAGPPAGWYPHPTMADTQRYWDGDAWTDHIAPMTGASAAASGPQRACPYCSSSMNTNATRCPHCGGELMQCVRCAQNQPVRRKSINVGLLRGGRVEQTRCAVCNMRLAGPAF